ncbi:MAG: hypothetical protein JRJ01_16025 [Deltaproteobacteria bacterium]|nr:hypothetical protein [Deltaproteobacteria bacterium]
MNKKGILFLFIFFLPLLVLTVPCNPEEGDSFEQFHRKYKSLEPREGSSAGTDYLIGQTALATFYTTKMLNLIHEQNRQLLEKYSRTRKLSSFSPCLQSPMPPLDGVGLGGLTPTT